MGRPSLARSARAEAAAEATAGVGSASSSKDRQILVRHRQRVAEEQTGAGSLEPRWNLTLLEGAEAQSKATKRRFLSFRLAFRDI